MNLGDRESYAYCAQLGPLGLTITTLPYSLSPLWPTLPHVSTLGATVEKRQVSHQAFAHWVLEVITFLWGVCLVFALRLHDSLHHYCNIAQLVRLFSQFAPAVACANSHSPVGSHFFLVWQCWYCHSHSVKPWHSVEFLKKVMSLVKETMLSSVHAVPFFYNMADLYSNTLYSSTPSGEEKNNTTFAQPYSRLVTVITCDVFVAFLPCVPDLNQSLQSVFATLILFSLHPIFCLLFWTFLYFEAPLHRCLCSLLLCPVFT